MNTSGLVNVGVVNTEYPQAQYKTVILKPNYEEGINVLTQEMFDAYGQNTKFVLKYDFVIIDNITIPEGCVLEFDGGTISGTYAVTGQNTILSGNVKCFTTIAGTFANDYLDITWFGAIGDDAFDNAAIIKNVFGICINSRADFFVPKGVFKATGNAGDHVISPGPPYNPDADVFDINSYASCNNISIVGEGKESVIKSYHNTDVICLYMTRDLNIKNIHVTSGIVEKRGDGHGQNLISLINAQNVHISGCFLSNGYYEAKLTESGFYLDGGAGITPQGRVFNNITIEDCEIENCSGGLRFQADASFFNTPDSYLYADNIRIKKCYTGVLAQTTRQSGAPSPDTYKNINSGYITIRAKTINCLQAFDAVTLCGANISIQNVSDETVEELSLNGYGNSWFDNYAYSEIPSFEVSCLVGRLYTCRNCNIDVSSYSKYLNYGFFLVGSYVINGNDLVCENNLFNLKLNSDATIVKKLGASEITDETKLFVSDHAESSFGYIMFDKSVFFINGCGNDNTAIDKFYKAGHYSNNIILVLDGRMFSENNVLPEILLKQPGQNVYNIIKGGPSCVLAENRASSDGKFLTIGSSKPSSNSVSIAFNGQGDISKESITSGVGVDIAQTMKGGGAIVVRSVTYPFPVLGYIPVEVDRSKGTTSQRPTLASTNSGFCYFDTTLGKPIWWDGSAWVDAAGEPVT